MDWKGKVAVVTGASSGIGLAVSKAFVQRGVAVALVARTEAKLQAVAQALGGKTAAFALDVTDRTALEALPSRVRDYFGRLDFVVNSAGVNHR